MIVDTSALMAIVNRETGAEQLARALVREDGLLPTPALVEFQRIVSRGTAIAASDADAMMAEFFSGRLRLLAFGLPEAEAGAAANAIYGIGNVRVGSLNLLDLMVYACAKVLKRPILCARRDFGATDAAIHPASRTG